MSMQPGQLTGIAVTDVDIADYVKLPGVHLFAELPPRLRPSNAGLLAFTSDVGLCVWTGTAWRAVP